MSSVLIHAEGGGKGTAADNGYACQLAEALDSPVLTKAAVQDGEGRASSLVVRTPFMRNSTMPCRSRSGEMTAGTHFERSLLPGIVLQCGGVAVEAEPFACPLLCRAV